MDVVAAARAYVSRRGATVAQRRHRQNLYGDCAPWSRSQWVRLHDRLRWGRLGEYIWRSRRIRGWARGSEAVALAKASASLDGAPTIVEVGSFLGCSAVLLAGARKLKGSGRVHCVDPFDGTGDAFSQPFYQSIVRALECRLRDGFERNIRDAGLSPWIRVHQMRGEDAARSWSEPIDLLFLDGDLSPDGAKAAFLGWSRFLRPGGVLAVSNSDESAIAPNHDGARLVVERYVRSPEYDRIVCVDGITFAVRTPLPPFPPSGVHT